MDSLLDMPLQHCQYPAWARGGHSQTIWGHLLPSPVLAKRGERHEILLADGDRLCAEYLPGTSDTLVYLFHGLSGDISADYMQRTAIACQREGHAVLLVNHRGAGAGYGLSRRPYHSGAYEDMATAISYGRKHFKYKKHGAIGFSMSGNILLLLLAQAGVAKPDFAITVNAPIQLEKSAYNLRVGLNRFYDFRFVQRLRELALEQLSDENRKYKISRLGTLMDFDEVYTAPAAGFKDRDDYYTSCSAKRVLSKIRVPSVLITAKDDPFVDWEDYMDAKFSSCTHFHLEKCGGHLGYITKKPTPLGTHRWLDYVLGQYIEALRTKAPAHCNDALVGD